MNLVKFVLMNVFIYKLINKTNLTQKKKLLHEIYLCFCLNNKINKYTLES